MNLEFRFDNNLHATVYFEQKIIKIYKKEHAWSHYACQWGDDLVCKPILYTSDNEMILALKTASERINLEQHEDITYAIYRYGYSSNTRYASDGRLMVDAPIDRLGNHGELIDRLIECGADFIGRHLSSKIMRDGICIAEITYC
jgi:hypothetical protein